MVGALAVGALAVTAAVAAVGDDQPAVGGSPSRWVHTWVSMPQLTEPGNMPPAPFTQDGLVLADATLRQTVHTSVGAPSRTRSRAATWRPTNLSRVATT